MLHVVVVAKGLVEFAALLLAGQALVYLVSFGAHERNPVYRLLRFLASPVVALARWLSPRVIIDRHVPAVALFMLFVVWVFLAFAKLHLTSLAAA